MVKYLMKAMCWIEDRLDYLHDKFCPCRVNFDCPPDCCGGGSDCCGESCRGEG